MVAYLIEVNGLLEVYNFYLGCILGVYIYMKINTYERKNAESVRRYVYDTLRESIMLLELKPGTKITEKYIAEKLGVSRTPVREALIKLSQEDLVTIYPQKGTFVSLIDPNHVEEAVFIRKNLEIAAVKSSCTNFPEDVLFSLKENLNSMEFQLNQPQINNLNVFNLDNEFHKLIFKGCGKEKAWTIITEVSTHLNRVRYLKMLVFSSSWKDVFRQHSEIVDAICNKDVHRGLEVLEEHLGKINIQMHELYSQYSMYFKK